MDGTLATILIFAGNFVPRGWAFCQGQLLSISQNTALFSLIGTTYGGNGQTTFGLPDLRGRVPIGAGTGPGLANYSLGQQGGVETVTLNGNEIPSHAHGLAGTASVSVTVGTNGEGSANVPANGSVLTDGGAYNTDGPEGALGGVSATLAGTTNNTGGNQPHENRAPYLAVNYVICLQGIFPSRD